MEKKLFQSSVKDLCNYLDAKKNMITFQHNEIKVSFQRSFHVMGYTL